MSLLAILVASFLTACNEPQEETGKKAYAPKILRTLVDEELMLFEVNYANGEKFKPATDEFIIVFDSEYSIVGKSNCVEFRSLVTWFDNGVLELSNATSENPDGCTPSKFQLSPRMRYEIKDGRMILHHISGQWSATFILR